MADKPESNAYFTGLVFSISQAAMMQMGKVTNPMTGKVERDMNQAKTSIDMLEMIREKTTGNLTKEEEKLMNDMLANLQLNYAEEANKKEPEEGRKQDEEKKSNPEAKN